MTQPALFPIDQVDPAEVEPEEHHIARMNAADVYNQSILSQSYARKAQEILASGNVTRIRLFRAWQARQQEAAA